jgi:hypothetical protein
MPRAVRLGLATLLALLVGLAGLGLVFTDIGPGGTGAGRVVTGAALFFLGGLGVGLLAPEGRAWLLAGACAWGLLLLGGMGLWLTLTSPASGDPALAALFVLGPLTASLAGGLVGARLRRGRRPGTDPAHRETGSAPGPAPDPGAPGGG